MSSNDLLEAALHVLVAWNTGNEPDPAEVEILRNAVPLADGMAIDELACQIIHREGGRLLDESGQRPSTQPSTDGKIGGGRVA